MLSIKEKYEGLYPTKIISSKNTIFDILEVDSLKNWLSQNHKSIIFDGGHLPVSSTFNESDVDYINQLSVDEVCQSLQFGGERTGASESQISSFIDAVVLYLHFKNKGDVSVKLHLCLTDTTRFLNPAIRRKISPVLSTQKKMLIPSEYLAIMDEVGIDTSNIYLTLQTSNANKFWDQTRKIKKTIKQGVNLPDIYKKYGALPIGIEDADYFGLAIPSLLETSEETEKLAGDWWYSTDCKLSPEHQALAPLAITKQQPIITLYSYGIKCPATAAGAYLSGDKEFKEESLIGEYVAIYSRDDDSEIGEKLNRAAFSARSVFRGNWNTNILNIIHSNNSSESEVIRILREEKVLFEFDDFKENLAKSLAKSMPDEASLFSPWLPAQPNQEMMSSELLPEFCTKDSCG